MLESLGLSADAEVVYRTMLGHPYWGVAELAAHLDMTESAVRDTLGELADRALVQRSRTETGALRVVSPQVGLTALLAQVEAEIGARQYELAAARAAIVAIAAEHDSQLHREELIRLEGVDAVRERLKGLAHTAETECLSFTAGATLPPTTIRSGMALNRMALERGVSIRNIYQESVRNHPATLAYAQRMASLGSRSRTVPAVPMRMTIVDRRVALLPIDPEGSTAGALEIRGPSMITALVHLFEQVWESATPFGEKPRVDERGLSPQEQGLLRLLDTGHTDESAGRKLGLSSRTVRRIVAELTDRLGVESRFQAGAEAVRRGWL